MPAKKVFEGAAGYNAVGSLAIPNEVLKELEIRHTAISGARSSLYRAFAKTGEKITWDAVEEIETKALAQAGMNAEKARANVRTAIRELKKEGVRGPTRIPWGG